MTIEQVVLLATAICGALATAVIALYRALDRVRDSQVNLVELVATKLTEASSALAQASVALTATAASNRAMAEALDRQTAATTNEHRSMAEQLKAERKTDRDDARRRNAEHEGR